MSASALDRLTRSRANLSQWLADDARLRSAPAAGRGVAALPWLQGLRRNPLAAIAIDAIDAWWTRQPAQLALHGLGATARTVIAPQLQRRPVVVLGVAVAGGALLVWLRPWRWLWRPAMLAGLVSQIAVHSLARVAAAPRPPA